MRGPPTSARAIAASAGVVRSHAGSWPATLVTVWGSLAVSTPRPVSLTGTTVTDPDAGPTSDGRYSHARADTAPPTTSTVPSVSRTSDGAVKTPV